MQRQQLTKTLNALLQPTKVKDYCPNGLQVEGRAEVQRIVTGVTASQALIDKAIEQNADALLVHHGYFWKGEADAIVGMKKRRIAALLAHDINLYAYHLPLDIHPQLGNNAQLAKLMQWQVTGSLATEGPLACVMTGELAQAVDSETLQQSLQQRLGRSLTAMQAAPGKIKTLAWCTGGGQGFIDAAADYGVDAFITGEVSEQTIHSAREHGLGFFAAGHHATERYGVKALGEYLAEQHQLDVSFIDIDNPA